MIFMTVGLYASDRILNVTAAKNVGINTNYVMLLYFGHQVKQGYRVVAWLDWYDHGNQQVASIDGSKTMLRGYA